MRLQVEDVSVRFGGIRALSNVNLEVGDDVVTGLIGPNGAGKTTLFNVISGLQRTEHGQVTLGDRNITSLSPRRRARLGVARTCLGETDGDLALDMIAIEPRNHLQLIELVGAPVLRRVQVRELFARSDEAGRGRNGRLHRWSDGRGIRTRICSIL